MPPENDARSLNGNTFDLIRLAPDHVPELVALERACFATPWSAAALIGSIARPISVAIGLADKNWKLVAYLIGRREDEHGDIDTLAVDPSKRRSGCATRLLQKALDVFADRGIVMCWLEVRESNVGAITLYKHFGFEIAGRRRNYYPRPQREDALVMSLNLNTEPGHQSG